MTLVAHPKRVRSRPVACDVCGAVALPGDRWWSILGKTFGKVPRVMCNPCHVTYGTPIDHPAVAEVRTGDWLDAQTFPTLSVRDLVLSGECHGECLCAVGDVEGCECSCNGYYHGVLSEQTVRPAGWRGAE